MKASVLLGALACTLILSVAPAAAQVVQLTGTWTGKWSCKTFDGVKFSEGNKASTLLITESGTTFAADIDAGEFRYNGAIIADDKKPDDKAEVAMVQCGTDNLPMAGPSESEIVRAQVKTKANSFKASFKGVSVFENDSPTVGTCKYSYKRTSTTDPAVPACP